MKTKEQVCDEIKGWFREDIGNFDSKMRMIRITPDFELRKKRLFRQQKVLNNMVKLSPEEFEKEIKTNDDWVDLRVFFEDEYIQEG